VHKANLQKYPVNTVPDKKWRAKWRVESGECKTEAQQMVDDDEDDG